MAHVAVVTVVFRAADTVIEWAKGLETAWRTVAQGAHRLSVVAIDNASDDGTPERLRTAAPWVNVIRQDANRGFAAACNSALMAVPHDAFVVLMNPDVVVSPDFFAQLLRIEWASDLVALGPQIRTPSGAVEQSARRFPTASTGIFGRTTVLSRVFPNSRGSRRQLLARPELGSREVDWVSGACLITHRVRFEEVGMLDEGYWMYWEDADWCHRAHDLGLRVEYRPELRVVHHQGASSASRPWRTAFAFHRSAARYYRRHVARSGIEAALAEAVLAGLFAIKSVAIGVRRIRFAGVPRQARSCAE